MTSIRITILPLKDKRFRATCFVLFLGVGLISCSPSSYLGMASSNPPLTSINELKPQKVETTVYIKGKVIDQAPFLGSGAYRLQDATGTIWVLTNQTPPKPGEEVMIRGKVTYQSIPISNRDIGEVYILEVEQLNRQTATEVQPTPTAVKPSATPTPLTPTAVKPSPTPESAVQVKPKPKPNTDALFLPHKQNNK